MSEPANPKMEGSGLIDCVPQTGLCPCGCLECYYNSDDWYRDRDKPLLPEPEDTRGKIVRMNSGHDSNIDRDRVIEVAKRYTDFFFNTSIPRFDFPGPVVFTCNGRPVTKDAIPDSTAFLIDPNDLTRFNLMYVRFRLNTWNVELADQVVKHYTGLGIPVVMTWMRYVDINNIPEAQRPNYEFKKFILTDYHSVIFAVRRAIMDRWKDNKLVRQCGTHLKHYCKDCGNCLWLYRVWKMDNYKREFDSISRTKWGEQ